MRETITSLPLLPGVTLRHCAVSRFRQGCLSIQFLRPMDRQEASVNALIPPVLLRGCRNYPDVRALTARLDDLYGAGISPLLRRGGDCQAAGLYCGFMEERFALPGDRVMAPVLDLLRQLLLDYPTRDGGFLPEFVAGEKENLLLAIDSLVSDKRSYAHARLLSRMCREDSFGIPRTGTRDRVEALEPAAALDHYRKMLEESPVEVVYVGSAGPDRVAELVLPLFAGIRRNCRPLPPQTPFRDAGGQTWEEEMDLAQSRLVMGFVTPVTLQSPDYAAMQVANMLFGEGMTSKLFRHVREKMSSCYEIGSEYFASKGILTVSAGIDGGALPRVRQEILRQLEALQAMDITPQELEQGRQTLLSGLRALWDSPGALEHFCTSSVLSARPLDPDLLRQALLRVTREDVARAAGTIRLHSQFFLRGTGQ